MPAPLVEYPPGATPAGSLRSTAPAETGLGEGPDSPLPVSDPDLSGFSYRGQWAQSLFDGSLFGLVESDLDARIAPEGRCLTLFGRLTPTETTGVVASVNDAPGFALLVDGELVEPQSFACDATANAAAGFDLPPTAAEVTLGTDGLFFEQFVLVGPGSLNLEAIVAGRPDDGEALYFEPTVLDRVPTVTPRRGAPVGADAIPAGDASASGFTYQLAPDHTEWDGFVFGVVEVPVSPVIVDGRRCLLVLTSLTPREAEGNRFGIRAPPEVSVVANGQLSTGSFLNCDVEEVRNAGFTSALAADLQFDETSLVYTEALLTDSEFAGLDVIIVGSPYNGGALLFEPTLLDSVPEGVPR